MKVTTDVPAATKSVAEVKWNLPSGEPATLDPAHSDGESVSTVDGNLCESLVRFGPDYALTPNLAKSIQRPDAKTYVFNLRDDVKFWDGQPMKPSDVVYSIKRINEPSVASSWAAAYTNLASVSQTGPEQVTVKLKKPDVLFNWYAATPATAVLEQKFTEAAGKQFGSAAKGVMCTGPLKFASWRRGQDIEITRNDDYWDASRTSKTESVRFSFDTDVDSQTAALVRGDIDGQFNNAVASFKQLKAATSGKLLFGASLSPTFIQLFANVPELKSPQLREALRDVVDYNGIAKSVYGSAASPIKTITPPATWGYAKDVFQQAYDAQPTGKQDLATAKRLVAQAGKQTGPITLAYLTSSPEESKIALAVQSAATQAGIDLKLKPMNATKFFGMFSDAKAREGVSGFLITSYLDFPEPIEADQYSTTGSYYNYGSYKNAQYDKLIDQAKATTDDAARAKLVTQAETIAYRDGYQIPIVTPYVNVFVNNRLTGVAPSQTHLYTPWAAAMGAS